MQKGAYKFKIVTEGSGSTPSTVFSVNEGTRSSAERGGEKRVS